MRKEILNYETLLKITHAVVSSKDPEDVAMLTVEGVKSALEAKGCALLLFNRKTKELEVAASFGLSNEYINKGPLSATRSIAESIKEGPVAIYDITDDPRIQYPEEARKEGIAAIINMPIKFRGGVLGSLRLYHPEIWHISEDDVNSLELLAETIGLAMTCASLFNAVSSIEDVIKNEIPFRLLA